VLLGPLRIGLGLVSGDGEEADFGERLVNELEDVHELQQVSASFSMKIRSAQLDGKLRTDCRGTRGPGSGDASTCDPFELHRPWGCGVRDVRLLGPMKSHQIQLDRENFRLEGVRTRAPPSPK